MIIECSRCHRDDVESETAWLTARITCEDISRHVRLCTECQHELGWRPVDLILAIDSVFRIQPRTRRDLSEDEAWQALKAGHIVCDGQFEHRLLNEAGQRRRYYRAVGHDDWIYVGNSEPWHIVSTKEDQGRG